MQVTNGNKRYRKRNRKVKRVMKKQEVTLSNIQIITSLDGLMALRQKELPVDLGFSLVDNLKTIRKRVEAYNEYRMELLKKYAKLDGQGNPVVKDNGFIDFPDKGSEKMAEADVVALNKAEVTDSYVLYTRQEFKAAGLPIAPAVLEVLDWMIREELPTV